MNTRDTVIQKLLKGAYICQVHGRRVLYEGNQIPVVKVTRGLYKYLYVVLKKNKNKKREVIGLRAVQHLHGRHRIKKAYRRLRRGLAEAAPEAYRPGHRVKPDRPPTSPELTPDTQLTIF